MRLFKRHESKETMGLEAGMKECLSCYRNVRCTECDYEDENNIMKAQIARLKIENQALRGAANFYKLHYNEAKTEAVKEFAERLKALDRLDVDVSYGYGREHYTEAISVNLIDNLIKEMAGEE